MRNVAKSAGLQWRWPDCLGGWVVRARDVLPYYRNRDDCSAAVARATRLSVCLRTRFMLPFALAAGLNGGFMSNGYAATLDVLITDGRGKPLPDTVVVVEAGAASGAGAGATGTTKPTNAAGTGNTVNTGNAANTVKAAIRGGTFAQPAAIMDQLNKQFVPQVLVIRAGTSVVFPNSDNVAHQVYSFSPAKRFSLGLYRGQPRTPVLFDEPGLVVLGCNIHDNMVGYIYVADSPYFGKTGADGSTHLQNVPAGTYRAVAWNSRFSEPLQQLEQQVTIGESSHTLKFTVTHGLRPATTETPGSQRLRDY